MSSITQHIKILIADDEALARKRVRSFLIAFAPQSELLEASTGKETISQIIIHAPDLVFLDIQMTDMTGFDVLQQIPKEKIPVIVFVTAYDIYAVKAFEVQAIDFLLKPYKEKRFLEALERAVHTLEVHKGVQFQEKLAGLMQYLETSQHKLSPNKENYLEKVVLKNNKKYLFIDTVTICYIKASGYYAEIYTEQGEKHIYRISMTHFMAQLDPALFSRINRSTIINRNFVKELVSEGMGDFSVVMKDREAFTISKKYKSDFLLEMGVK